VKFAGLSLVFCRWEDYVYRSQVYSRTPNLAGIGENNGYLSHQNLKIGQNHGVFTTLGQQYTKLEMWANAQRDGRPAEHRWRPLFNAAKFG